MMDDNELAEQLAEKASYGDPAVIVDGDLRWTLKVDYDDIPASSEINGCDAYGKVAWCERDRYTRFDAERPQGFTGAAHKLRTSTGDAFWWEPYRDEGGDTADSPEFRQLVIDLMSWGFHYVSLKLETKGCCGHFHETGFAAMGGIDDVGVEYLTSITLDFIGEARSLGE